MPRCCYLIYDPSDGTAELVDNRDAALKSLTDGETNWSVHAVVCKVNEVFQLQRELAPLGVDKLMKAAKAPTFADEVDEQAEAWS